jgi:uncharacterized delta-60 repeat protein
MGGETKWLTRTWAVALLLGCLVAAAPAAAKVGAGRLDQSFGGGGKVLAPFPAEEGEVGVKYALPFQFSPGKLEAAIFPGGKLVVAGSTRLTEYLPSGKVNPAFGQGGSAEIPQPPGGRFVLAGIATDSQGRVLIAGSARPVPTGTTPDPLASAAIAMRFQPDGTPDGTFGNGGTLVTDFGIQPPKIGWGRYPAASVGVEGLAVDPENRPVLTGGSVSRILNCRGIEESRSTGFIARLTEGGTPDPSFGTGGVGQIASISSFGPPNLTSFGTTLTAGGPDYECQQPAQSRPALTSFGPDSNVDPNFGVVGFRAIDFDSPPTVAIAPGGKILLFGQVRGPKGNVTQIRQKVVRLLSNGAFDPGFGRGGRVILDLPRRSHIGAIAGDRRGRVLLAGQVSVGLPDHPSLRRSKFVLTRMTRTGRLDLSFGRGGSVVTGFGGDSSSTASQVQLYGGNRILVGGRVSTPRLKTGGGFAIARYLGGR